MRNALRMYSTRIVGALWGLAVLGLASGAGCGGDLGEPALRYADWDARAPGEDAGGTNPSTLADWLPDCGPGYYPCPPYGAKRNDVLADFRMTAANDEALALAGPDGVFSLGDLHRSGKKVLFVFITAGW